MINVMVLQNHMDLLRGELHSCGETCLTSTQVERLEPKVSCVCGECIHISYGLYSELHAPLSVCTCGKRKKIDFRERILSTF